MGRKVLETWKAELLGGGLRCIQREWVRPCRLSLARRMGALPTGCPLWLAMPQPWIAQLSHQWTPITLKKKSKPHKKWVTLCFLEEKKKAQKNANKCWIRKFSPNSFCWKRLMFQLYLFLQTAPVNPKLDFLYRYSTFLNFSVSNTFRFSVLFCDPLSRDFFQHCLSILSHTKNLFGSYSFNFQWVFPTSPSFSLLFYSLLFLFYGCSVFCCLFLNS